MKNFLVGHAPDWLETSIIVVRVLSVGGAVYLMMMAKRLLQRTGFAFLCIYMFMQCVRGVTLSQVDDSWLAVVADRLVIPVGSTIFATLFLGFLIADASTDPYLPGRESKVQKGRIARTEEETR